jgi:hypothetical protein
MLSLHRPTSNSSPWLSPTETWRTRSAGCLQDNSSARTPRKTPSSFVKDACLQLRCLAIYDLLFRGFAWRRQHRKHSYPYIVVTFLKGRVYLPSLRNGNSSIVACIRCHENVYGHSSIVIDTAHMSQYNNYCWRHFRFRGSCIRHDIIAYCRNWISTALEWPLMA